jgi:hypothetical protein
MADTLLRWEDRQILRKTSGNRLIRKFPKGLLRNGVPIFPVNCDDLIISLFKPWIQVLHSLTNAFII